MGASRDMEYDIRNDFFRHLQPLPLGYYQARRTGDLMSRATNDLSAVRMMIGPAVMYAVTTGFLFVVAIALMLSINVRLTLIALIPLPFVSIAVRYFGTAIHARFERIQAQLSEMSAVVQEALAGVRVVRAYRQEAAEIERFREANEEYLRRNRALIGLQGLFYPSLTFLLGRRRADRALARQPRRDPRTDDGRRVRRVQRLSRHVELADDRVRLGHQPAAARHGVVEADARGARRQRPAIDDAARAGALGPRRTRDDSRRDRVSRSDVRLRRSASCSSDISLSIAAGRDGGARRARPAAASRRWSACCRGCTIRRPARCSSTASTCARCRSTCCAAPSAWCRRSRFCSRTRWRRTSPSARRTATRSTTSSRRRPSRASTRTSTRSRAPGRRWWASAG